VDYFDYNRFDIEEFLRQSQEREKHRLEKELERIERQLEQRDRLYEETLDELESKLDWYIDRLELLYKRSPGETEEKQELKQEIKRLYREIRQEKRHRWRDKVDLEMELREVKKGLEGIENESSLWEQLM